jgi:NAD(P)-dependent dehydrogenase (short-subunit alcohol dehydrogenase family)
VPFFGGIDIIANNAAIIRDGFIFKADALDWDAVIGNNLSTPFHVLAAATPVLRAQAKALRGGTASGWGGIVNIVSTRPPGFTATTARPPMPAPRQGCWA